jgi:hypothetical protein
LAGREPWFTEAFTDKIGRITKSGLLKEFPIPTAGAIPKDITEGAGGFLWFTEAGGNKIARLNPADGSITELPVPTPSASPFGITVGPGSCIWFTELTGNQIGRVNSDDSISEFPIPTAGSDPVGIAWLRRRQLLPRRHGHPGPDGCLSAQVRARLPLRTAGLGGSLPRPAVAERIRRVRSPGRP